MFDMLSKTRSKDTADFVARLAYMAEIREWDNRAHIERVRRYCMVMTQQLGLTAFDSEIISMACQLHDVGKITLPDELTKRAGNYEDHEWALVMRHTVEGAKLLESSTNPVLMVGATIARTHHERWDGSGYPARLRGDAIPLSARICALADVFDALTSQRSYKPTVTPDEALRMILQSSGTLFDPNLVRIFESKFSEIKKIRQITSAY